MHVFVATLNTNQKRQPNEKNNSYTIAILHTSKPNGANRSIQLLQWGAKQ